MDLGIKGKNVVVTGASQGMGASIAYRFLEEGANVLLVSSNSECIVDALSVGEDDLIVSTTGKASREL